MTTSPKNGAPWTLWVALLKQIVSEETRSSDVFQMRG